MVQPAALQNRGFVITTARRKERASLIRIASILAVDYLLLPNFPESESIHNSRERCRCRTIHTPETPLLAVPYFTCARHLLQLAFFIPNSNAYKEMLF